MLLVEPWLATCRIRTTTLLVVSMENDNKGGASPRALADELNLSHKPYGIRDTLIRVSKDPSSFVGANH